MIEIRTRNGGRGVGEVTDFDGTHLLFVVDDGKRMVWVPIDRIVWVSPA